MHPSAVLNGWLKPVFALLLTAILSAGCQGSLPFVPEAAATSTPTDDSPRPTPTAIVIIVRGYTPTPDPSAQANAPTARPTTPVNSITRQNVAQVVVRRNTQASRSTMLAVEFSPDSARFAAFGFDKLVRVIDGDSLTTEFTLSGHNDYGHSAAWSPDGSMLATGGGFQLILWDTETGAQLSTTPIQAQIPYRVVWSSDSQRIAVVGGRSSHLEIVGRDGGIVEDVQINRSMMWAVDTSLQGSVAVSNAMGHILILDSETYEIAQDIYTGATAWDLAFSPDGSMLAACFSGGSVGMWDTSNWSRLWLETGHIRQDCADGEWTHSGELYFTGGGDGALIGWEPESGSQLFIRNLSLFIWGISISHDDRLIAAAMDDGEINILGLP